MKYLTGHEIKKTWLRFFEDKGHKIEESASLVPINDPTLLWINAGVAPLKGYFDGSKVPSNPRIANVQKCIRTNDIENVGKTARHHTFFEMLGNFSIGDYFRDQAIEWGLEILTSEKYFGFDKDKLYMTVYPTDDESYQKWIDVGVDPTHIIRTTDNFWEIGPGPCGPSTEIFYDRGDAFGKADLDMIKNDIENDRYVEIWNIVLSQFNAKKGLSREEYPELPSKNIDTGMGLERMAAIIQGVKTNFETDLFMPVIQKVEALSDIAYDGQMSFKVIADHLRSVVFAISDGATFSNEGRGYVLRRLLRRAVKHGKQLGIQKPFLGELVDTVIEMMHETYPYLLKTRDFTKTIIEKEEKKFLETLSLGEKMLEDLLKNESKTISGKDAFKLYDTYGFPLELTEEYALSEGFSIDKDGFKEHMEAQRERARQARKEMTGMNAQNEAYLKFKTPSEFVGYETLKTETKIIKIFDIGVVVEKTPFYAESGGQVADRGVIISEGRVHEVSDVQKLPNNQFIHILEAHDLKEGAHVTMQVDETSRELTKAHHSATHLMFAKLREMFGSHVMQQGSLVGPDYLRFDFNHLELPDEKTLLSLEEAVNKHIGESIDVVVEKTTVEEAKKRGAIAEFGEKYESSVRMVNMGITLDLCGGTHVENTQEIERFAIANIESKGSGIYRIVALAKDRVSDIGEYLQGFESNLHHLSQKKETLLNKALEDDINLTFEAPKSFKYQGSYQDVIDMRKYLNTYQKAVKNLEKTYDQRLKEQSLSNINQYLDQALDNGNIVVKTTNIDKNALKTLADRLMEHVKEGVVFLANIDGKKIVFIAKSTTDIHAGNLVKEAAKIAGGGGGGRPDFAQAGGKDVTKIDDVLSFVKEQVS